MKKIELRLLKYMAALVTAVMALTMVSCGSDDDETAYLEVGKTDYVEVEYSVDLSEAWYRFYDISVSYTGRDGVIRYENFEADRDVKFRVDYDVAPRDMQFTVIASPKAESPQIDDDRDVIFDQNCSIKVKGYTFANQRTMLDYLHRDPDRYTVAPGNMSRQLEQDLVLFTATCRLD
ncbi:MAG: hypothetical protein ACI4US_04055 [Muribaculaceae bacterium]